MGRQVSHPYAGVQNLSLIVWGGGGGGGGGASPSQVTPSILLPVPICTPG